MKELDGGYAYPVTRHVVGMNIGTRGDRKKLISMATSKKHCKV